MYEYLNLGSGGLPRCTCKVRCSKNVFPPCVDSPTAPSRDPARKDTGSNPRGAVARLSGLCPEVPCPVAT